MCVHHVYVWIWIFYIHAPKVAKSVLPSMMTSSSAYDCDSDGTSNSA